MSAAPSTQPANSLRGEAELVLDGVRLRLRPSFAALVAAEEELGALLALVERASAGALRLSEIAALFWHCVEKPVHLTREAFSEALARCGLAACTAPLRVLLGQILKGSG